MSEKLDIRLKTFDARPETFDARLKTFDGRLLNGLPLDDLNTTCVCETGSGVFWLTTSSMRKESLGLHLSVTTTPSLSWEGE